MKDMLIKRKLTVVISTALILSLSSCVGYYSDISHLSENELEWINCYNVGDTVLFQSDNSDFDTLIVDYKNIQNSRKRFFIHFIDNYMGSKYNARAQYDFYIKHEEDIITGRFEMTKLAETDSIEWGAFLGNLYSDDWPYEHDFERGRNTYLGDNPIKVVNLILKEKNWIIV